MVWVSLCQRQKELCQISQVHFTEEFIQLLAFHAPGVQSKFMLLRVWLCWGHFHSSCQTKGFTLFSLQPLYTHWSLLPYSEKRKVLACSYFISELLFFLVTEGVFKGWGQLWHWSEAILKKWKCNALLVMRRCVPELSVQTGSMDGAHPAQEQQCKGQHLQLSNN